MSSGNGLAPYHIKKTIDWLNFKAFAEDNLNVAKMTKLVFDRVENIAGKENAGDQHFLLFPQCFQVDFLGVVESRDCVVKG